MRAHLLIASLLAPAVLLLASDGSTNTPCPPNSAGDRAFSFDRDAKSCVFGAVEGNSVGSGLARTYNVYCPSRMTPEDTVRVGTELAQGKLLPSSPMRTQYAALDTVPSYQKITHRFHYGCKRDGKSCVATHLKVEVRRGNVTTPAMHAKHCRQIKQNGGVISHTNMDRQYRCALEFHTTNRGRAQEAAKLLLRGDAALLADFRSKNLKMCVLGTTDIQCAPCMTSDNLIARTRFVAKQLDCPAGTIDTVE